MADFSAAFPIIANHEGGYSLDKDDRGGETYAGITRKNFPRWAGWLVIDQREMRNGDKLEELSPLVKNFYKVNFWDRFKGDAFDSQDVANFVFDWFVNSGNHAIKALQRTIGVTADCVVGDETIHAVNACNEVALMRRLKDTRIKFYQNIVANDPSQKKFLKGWTNRVNSFA